MEQRKFSDSRTTQMSCFQVTRSRRTIEIELAPVRWVKPGSFGVECIRIAPGSQQRLQDYLAALEGAASDAA
jgi:hypothetical protein